MLRPSDFIITNFSDLAQGQTALCVGVRPNYKDYKNGIAGDICGYSYELVLPSRKYEHIAMKVPGSALINPELFSTPNTVVAIEQIQDFCARWYKNCQYDGIFPVMQGFRIHNIKGGKSIIG